MLLVQKGWYIFYSCVLFINNYCVLIRLPEYGTPAFNNIVNVRFIHALVRKRIKNHPEWKGSFIPVNQFALAGTLMFFCQTPIEMMKKRGIAVSPEECEACWQLWRYVGYLLGMNEDIIPETYEHGLRMKYHPLVLEKQRPTDISSRLAQNTIAALEADPKIPFDKIAFYTALEQHIGKDLFSKLELPTPTLMSHIHYRLLNFWLSHIRFCDTWSSTLRNWKNYFFLRYLIGAGVIRATEDQKSHY